VSLLIQERGRDGGREKERKKGRTDLELSGVLHDGDDSLKLIGVELSGPKGVRRKRIGSDWKRERGDEREGGTDANCRDVCKERVELSRHDERVGDDSMRRTN
jgi:hypothetical protein